MKAGVSPDAVRYADDILILCGFNGGIGKCPLNVSHGVP